MWSRCLVSMIWDGKTMAFSIDRENEENNFNKYRKGLKMGPRNILLRDGEEWIGSSWLACSKHSTWKWHSHKCNWLKPPIMYDLFLLWYRASKLEIETDLDRIDGTQRKVCRLHFVDRNFFIPANFRRNPPFQSGIWMCSRLAIIMIQISFVTLVTLIE